MVINLVVTVTDSSGRMFKRKYNETASNVDAVRWTLTSRGIECFIDLFNIIKIELTKEPFA